MRKPALAAALLALASTGGALAAPLPKASSNFAGNLRTLTQDSKASGPIAECAAHAHDFARESKWDRLGFTRANLAAAKTVKAQGKFSVADPRDITSAIIIPATARLRKSTDGATEWQEINVRCGLKGDRMIAIELTPAAP